jgi:hypothetical protein
MDRRSVLIARVALVLVVLVLASPLWAQQSGEEGTEPVEYGEDEFSPFLRSLRRGEIIMLGSFPLTLFMTLEAFDIYRFIDNRDEPDSYRYAFWPYRSPDPAPYRSGEITGIVVTALSASLVIAVVDYIVGRVKHKRSER